MPDLELFRAIAGAMLDQRIRNMRRLEEKTWIDTTLITHAEYQLFLDEMYAQGSDHEPDHWQKKHFLPGEAQTPVVGIRPSDAVAFCEWLSEQGWGKFRLPLAKETHDLEETLPGFWQFVQAGEDQFMYRGKLPVLAPALALDLDRALARALDLDRDLALDRALDLDRALALDRTLALDRALDRGLDHDLDLDRLRDYARALARDYARALDRDRALSTIEAQSQIILSSLFILSLRREGLLRAFEGILIVREED